MKRKPDVHIHNNGSVVMVEPVTRRAVAWVATNVGLEDWQWFGGAFACEPRHVDNLVNGMQADGLTVTP
jgi:hypothetical protein